MSPEHNSHLNVAKSLRVEVRNKMDELKLDFNAALNNGYAFCKPNGCITKISFLEDLPETILNEGKKNNSPWHIVYGIAGAVSNKHTLEHAPNHEGHRRRNRRGRS